MNRREKYLSVFYELETEVIISSIQKCEYFLINYLHNSKKNQFYSSTSDNSKEGNKEDENTLLMDLYSETETSDAHKKNHKKKTNFLYSFYFMDNFFSSDIRCYYNDMCLPIFCKEYLLKRS